MSSTYSPSILSITRQQCFFSERASSSLLNFSRNTLLIVLVLAKSNIEGFEIVFQKYLLSLTVIQITSLIGSLSVDVLIRYLHRLAAAIVFPQFVFPCNKKPLQLS